MIEKLQCKGETIEDNSINIVRILDLTSFSLYQSLVVFSNL